MQRAPVKQPEKVLTKKAIARSRKEARQLRIIWISVATLAVAVLAVLAYALIHELVIVPNRAVAVVNGNKISAREYEPVLMADRAQLHNNISSLENALAGMDTTNQQNQFIISFYQQQLQQLQSMLTTVQDSALEQVIDDELVREKATQAGLAVTPQEVDTYLHDQLVQYLTPSTSSPVTNTQGITVTPTAIPQTTLDSTYKQILTNMRVSDGDYRAIVQRSLLSQKLQKLLATQVPTTGLVVHVDMIEVNVSNTVTTTLQRVDSGEDFATVAKEVSSLPDAKTNGGDLGWQAAGMLSGSYGTAVEDLAFSLAPGKTGKVESNGKWYVIKVVDKNENGPLPQQALTTKRDNALTDWLAEQKKTAKIERRLTASDVPPDPFGTSTSPPAAQPTG